MTNEPEDSASPSATGQRTRRSSAEVRKHLRFWRILMGVILGTQAINVVLQSVRALQDRSTDMALWVILAAWALAVVVLGILYVREQPRLLRSLTVKASTLPSQSKQLAIICAVVGAVGAGVALGVGGLLDAWAAGAGAAVAIVVVMSLVVFFLLRQGRRGSA